MHDRSLGATRSTPDAPAYLANLSRPEVSPRARSPNISFALAVSHSTEDPTGVYAFAFDTGTVRVSP